MFICCCRIRRQLNLKKNVFVDLVNLYLIGISILLVTINDSRLFLFEKNGPIWFFAKNGKFVRLLQRVPINFSPILTAIQLRKSGFTTIEARRKSA